MSTVLEIGYEQARDLLELAVEERGADYVYEPGTIGKNCLYFEESGEPSCIVGWVLNRLGMRFSFNGICNGAGVYILVEEGRIKLDWKTSVLLNSAQALQDDGKPWGFAVALAVALAETVPESVNDGVEAPWLPIRAWSQRNAEAVSAAYHDYLFQTSYTEGMTEVEKAVQVLVEEDKRELVSA